MRYTYIHMYMYTPYIYILRERECVCARIRMVDEIYNKKIKKTRQVAVIAVSIIFSSL